MKAPAKINLLLKVLLVREDGNHNIESVMQAIDLYDEIEVEIKESASSNYSIKCEISGAVLPENEDNIAYRAAQIFLESYQINCAVNIRIAKRIPIAAGLAGGSADAAAVLLSLAAKYKPEKTLAELASLGVKLGADVPFQIYTCAKCNPALGYGDQGFATATASGVGEILTPVHPVKKANIMLVNPGIFISAGKAYQLFDLEGKTSETQDAIAMSKALESGNESTVISYLSNDLMCPVANAYPGVKELMTGMSALCESRGGRALMSGSGSTVFGLFYDEGEACKAYEEAQKNFLGMFCVLTETV